MVVIPEGLSLEQSADFYAYVRSEEHRERIRIEYDAKIKADPSNARYYQEQRDNDLIGADSLVPVYRECFIKRHTSGRTYLTS